jgi:hypothetical protein
VILTTEAVQLPTIQFFLALFCKIDNRDIMPHEYKCPQAGKGIGAIPADDGRGITTRN